MDALLQSEEWTRWDESLQRIWYTEADMAEHILSAAAFKHASTKRSSCIATPHSVVAAKASY